MKGRELWKRLLAEQRRWIEKCENGRSYLGPNGQAIREADEQELQRLEWLVEGRKPTEKEKGNA